MAARPCGLLAAFATVAIAAPARADDCYRIKTGTPLYGDVMGDTQVGETTADVIGWFGHTFGNDPTLSVKLVALDGDVVQDEIVVSVKKDATTAVACPAAWRRGNGETVDLTWPDASWAGQAARSVIAPLRKQAKPRFGRACFASTVTGVKATVCTPVSDHPKTTCVSIASRKPVYARATTASKVGVTTARVVGEQLARLDNLVAVRIQDGADSHSVYVKPADTRAARCSRAKESNVGVLGVLPTHEALLPDGTDAAFRVFPPSASFGDIGGADQTVTVGGRTLHCFDHTPVTGLQLHVCTAN